MSAKLSEMRDCRRSRRGTLPADHLWPITFHIVEDDRNIAARSVEVRLHDLQREGGCGRRIEGVAAFFQRCHTNRGCDPVRGCNNPEGAFNLRAGRKGVGIDFGYTNFHAPGL